MPESATPILTFVRRVQRLRPVGVPLLVHCSAGVGRSGAFVTLDSMLQKMDAEQVIDVYNFVSRIRSKRGRMVQTAVSVVVVTPGASTVCVRLIALLFRVSTFSFTMHWKRQQLVDEQRFFCPT